MSFGTNRRIFKKYVNKRKISCRRLRIPYIITSGYHSEHIYKNKLCMKQRLHWVLQQSKIIEQQVLLKVGRGQDEAVIKSPLHHPKGPLWPILNQNSYKTHKFTLASLLSKYQTPRIRFRKNNNKPKHAKQSATSPLQVGTKQGGHHNSRKGCVIILQNLQNWTGLPKQN